MHAPNAEFFFWGGGLDSDCDANHKCRPGFDFFLLIAHRTLATTCRQNYRWVMQGLCVVLVVISWVTIGATIAVRNRLCPTSTTTKRKKT